MVTRTNVVEQATATTGRRVLGREQPGWVTATSEGSSSNCLQYGLHNGGNAMKKTVQKLLRSKGVYYLLMIAALGLALGASWKWHP